MTQKVSKKKASVSKNVSGGSGKQLQSVWSYIRFFYQQNEQIWQRCAQYERDIVELRSLIKEVA